ncbi:MAG TPA: hypothetical protein VK919_06570 [Solirubrobacterales bacterium]|nr:hypothetical protein [Solirubrobacterales bacterium]
MVELGLYRIAFAPALLAFVALMFSLQGVPAPLEPAVPPSFDPARAAATGRAIVSAAPVRPPGSQSDAAAADIVAEGFGSIRAGTVSEQLVSASYDGDDVTVRNVLITLPGDSARTVAIIAGRDSPQGPGAASTAAATGALVELATALGVSGHAKTYVLASTSAYVDGAAGARAVVEALPDPDAVDAIIVLSQPGVSDPVPPFVIGASTGANRTAAQLDATAQQSVADHAGLDDSGPGALGELARLAFPSGAGLEAPLIDADLNAIALSASGERTIPPADDGPDDVSRRTLGDFGSATTALVQAIEVADAPLDHGAGAYLEVGDNLIPGWTLALLALTLLLPAWIAAADAGSRAARRHEGLGHALAWAAGKAAPALAALLVLYALALVGLIPRPAFPFDPGTYGAGAAGVASIALLAAVAIAAGLLITRRLPPGGVTGATLVAAAGIVSGLAGLLAWFANPYLGLLLAPAVHVWLLAATGARTAAVALAALAALAPPALALAAVASALELGSGTPWTFVLMLADGQIGFPAALALALVTGGLAASIAAARRDPAGAGPG